MTRVECESLSLSILFEPQYSSILDRIAWHVHFAPIPRAGSQEIGTNISQHMHIETDGPRKQVNLVSTGQKGTKAAILNSVDNIKVPDLDQASEFVVKRRHGTKVYGRERPSGHGAQKMSPSMFT